MKPIIGGLIAVSIFIVICIIINIIKATKDPDVIAASNLRMNINRYKQYKKWYDEHQRLMRIYGTDSKQANEYFLSFFKQIENKNEWRIYQQYRLNS